MATPLLLIPGISMLSFIFIKELNSLYRFILNLSVLGLAHTLFLLHIYDPNTSQFQFQLSLDFNNSVHIIGGLDSLSLWLILLTNIIIPIVILNSWKSSGKSTHMIKEYLLLILMIQFLSILVFFVLDLFLFYVSFEALLIPMYYLIGFYGSRNKKN